MQIVEGETFESLQIATLLLCTKPIVCISVCVCGAIPLN